MKIFSKLKIVSKKHTQRIRKSFERLDFFINIKYKNEINVIFKIVEPVLNIYSQNTICAREFRGKLHILQGMEINYVSPMFLIEVSSRGIVSNSVTGLGYSSETQINAWETDTLQCNPL